MKRMNTNVLGFSSVEVLTATVIMGISGLAIASFSETVSKHMRDVNSKTSIADVRTSIIQSTVYAKSWGLNISKAGSANPNGGSSVNPEMTCLKAGSPCAEGIYNLTLFSPDGNVLIDAQNSNQGFTSRGAPCSTYTDAQDNLCVFRFELQWQPVCPPSQTSCLNPQIRLTGQLKVKQTYAQAVNIQVNTMALDIFAAKPDLSASATPPTPSAPTTPGGVVYYTNSTLYSTSNTVTNDLASTVSNPAGMTFSLTASASAAGGSLSLSGTKVTYTPPTGFYGHDSFNYTVKDSSGTGTLMTAKMEVMTPYTWTGQGGNSDASNKNNWCGEVVNGQCDHATFYGSSFLGPETKVVMDGTCQSNCDATFAQPYVNITSLETQPGYTGTVTVSSVGFHINNIGTGTSFVATNIINNSSDTMADLDLRGGSFICTSTGAMVIYGSINVTSSVKSVQFCPTVTVYTSKNNPSANGGSGVVPPSGTYTGINITATAPQLPTWSNPGNTITIHPVLSGKPEVFVDPSLPLNQFNVGNCLSSATCQVFVSSPPPTSGSNFNSNIVDGIGDDNCESFFSQASVLYSKATNDIDETNGTGIYISEAARNIINFKTWGGKNVFFKSALGVNSVSGVSSKTMVINTLKIDTLFNTATTTMCIKASHIVTIKGQATGGMYISADKIDEITNVAGEFYVLGATIGKVNGGAGKLCLYNGAKVLDISNFAGTVSSSCSVSFPNN